MQVAGSISELRAEIEAAFAGTEVPPAEDVLAERYRDAVDPGEMLAVLRGKHWHDLGRRDLFLHRESLSALSARGFRAYVAAYLLASLEERRLRPCDTCVQPPSLSSPRRRERDEERLSALDDGQRAAIGTGSDFVAETKRAKILQHWS